MALNETLLFAWAIKISGATVLQAAPTVDEPNPGQVGERLPKGHVFHSSYPAGESAVWGRKKYITYLCFHEGITYEGWIWIKSARGSPDRARRGASSSRRSAAARR